MHPTRSYRKPYRSLFWPVVMIGVGVIWLLSNLDLISTDNLYSLSRLWPVLMVVAGLDVLFARRFPLIGALLGLLVIADVVFLLLRGDALGLEPGPTPRTETYSVEVGDTEHASFEIDLSVQPATVHALTDQDTLVFAEIGHYGEINFSVTGERSKVLSLHSRHSDFWSGLFLPESEETPLSWDIGLNTAVPFDLKIDASAGQSELDLSGIQLERFAFDGSTGASAIFLPESDTGYETTIDASAGALEIILPSETDLTLRLDGSTGSVVFDVPDGAALAIEVQNGGSGDLLTPDWITKITGKLDRDEGVYQTEGFETAPHQLRIIITDISTGNIVVR